jgi:hypothetical protein
MKECSNKLVLIHTFISFIKGIVKPIFSNEELSAFGDVSVSSVTDHAHMGFLTIIADFLGTLIFYRKSKNKDFLESISKEDIEKSISIYELELESRKNSTTFEEGLYYILASKVLSKDQAKQE